MGCRIKRMTINNFYSLMCTQIKTSEFFPAVLYCKTHEGEKRAHFSISEDDLWDLAKKVEKKCWSNVNLNRKDLRDLIPFMDYVYGPNFIQWNEKNLSFIVNNLDQKTRESMSGYFFSCNTKWFKQLESIIANPGPDSTHSNRLAEKSIAQVA